ncbi:stage III sporulation protein AA [Cellulosilyticum ruminicola]|uniref:stage III sporulation protein AA n=1 Tax=Cellulosilyticum ruminicola TaxID=425254 RepID=UPI0006D28964|nr:stage III sporulation protein AA [Cellulosilyticum ruminicola]
MERKRFIGRLPSPLKEMLSMLTAETFNSLQEIRLRIGQPITLHIGGEQYGLNEKGKVAIHESYRVKRENIEQILKSISEFSLYAMEEEIRQGFITIEGGHRIGIVGKAVLEHAGIKTLKYISGMNIRIAHEVVGCANSVMPYIVGKKGVYHTLIVSPPGCGKTTLLRDVIRQLSYGFSGYGPYTVGVVDERSEIGACYLGVPQNDLGPQTDILDNCPKVEGMRMLLRAMGPDVVAVDEIGKTEDVYAIEEMLCAGVSILCTVHGRDLEECRKKTLINKLIEEGAFERVIILSHKRGICTIENIITL